MARTKQPGLLSPESSLAKSTTPCSDDGSLTQQPASAPSLISIHTKSQKSNDSGSTTSRMNPENTRYRSYCLNGNGVFVQGAADSLPVSLAEEVERIFRRRNSPELDDAKAADICHAIELLEEEAKEVLRGEYVTMGVVPSYSEMEKPPSLKRLLAMPFLPSSRILLPAVVIPPGVKSIMQPISNPKPDVTYGYTLAGWNSNQALAQKLMVDGFDMGALSMPFRELYWPFFVVEFKARATGGNLFVATNQCAGDGSACVKAAYTLYQLALQAAERAAAT